MKNIIKRNMTRLITAKRNIKDFKLSGCLRDDPGVIIGRHLFCAYTELRINGIFSSVRYNHCNPDRSNKSIGDKIVFYQSRTQKKSLKFQGIGTIVDIKTQDEILSNLNLRVDYNWMLNNVVGRFYGYTREVKKNKRWAVVRIDKLISPMKSIELSNQPLFMAEVNKKCIQHGRVIHSNTVKNIVDAIIS